MGGYTLRTAPAALAGFLDRVTGELRAAFADQLVGAVLHGSLAMGAFHPPKSDIDLLLVVRDLGRDERLALWRLLAGLDRGRPYAAGLEVSAITAADAAAPRHPLPYLVHYSQSARPPDPGLPQSPLTDPDLIAHLHVARARGVSLFGPAPAGLIGPVARADYLAAVRYDIDEILAGETILESPRYGVLNLCRWAMLCAGEGPDPASKEEGALWALGRAPAQHRALVGQALEAHRSAAPVDGAGDLRQFGGPWPTRALVAFRDWARGLPPPAASSAMGGPG